MEGRSEAEIERDDEHLVTVQELIDSVRKLQSTPDSSKLERIAEVSCFCFEIKINVVSHFSFKVNQSKCTV